MVPTRLLSMFLLLAIAGLAQQAECEARYSPNNPEDSQKVEDDMKELLSEDEEDEDEGEMDLEEEVFGTKVKRFAGINIVNEELETVISDPSEHVLRALSSPEEKNNALTLEKVRAMYKEQQEKEAKAAAVRNTRDIASLNFVQMMKRETQA